MFRGLHFCRKCGAVLGKRIDKLARGCLPPTIAGMSNIKRIRNGKLPNGVVRWPRDPGSLLPIEEEAEKDYIHPGTDVFGQPSHNPSVTYSMVAQSDTIRQVNADTRRHGIQMAAASSSVQVLDCRNVVTIPRRTSADDDDSSSD